MSYFFTTDMGRDRTQKNLLHIIKLFGIPNTMIEVGCFEGYTTCWMADTISAYNADFKIYAIDPHEALFDQDQHVDSNEKYNFNNVRQTFEQNIKLAKGNIVYLNKPSYRGLIDLINQNQQVELIFIDGDHTASAVLEDMILSWRLLKPGGVMLCDDAVGFQFVDKFGNSPVQLSPRMGIEMFIQTHWHKIKLLELPNNFQTAFQKLEN